MTAGASWRIGAVRVTSIVEQDLPIPFAVLVPDATPDVVAAEPWLRPHWAIDDETFMLRIQALVVESGDRRMVVDTCVGNDKQRTGYDFFTGMQSGFLDHLTGAGFAPETIDVVVCTHLHMDHVGFNTRLVDGAWVPTFPAARYLFSRTDYDHWRANDATGDPDREAFDDSVAPIVEAGLADLIALPHRLTDEVTLVSTPGHTPGHCSVMIESEGHRGVITGDLTPHPIQLARPELASGPDVDRAQATATRRALVAEVCDTETLVIGTHYHAPSAGRVVRVDGGVRLVP